MPTSTSTIVTTAPPPLFLWLLAALLLLMLLLPVPGCGERGRTAPSPAPGPPAPLPELLPHAARAEAGSHEIKQGHDEVRQMAQRSLAEHARLSPRVPPPQRAALDAVAEPVRQIEPRLDTLDAALIDLDRLGRDLQGEQQKLVQVDTQRQELAATTAKALTERDRRIDRLERELADARRHSAGWIKLLLIGTAAVALLGAAGLGFLLRFRAALLAGVAGGVLFAMGVTLHAVEPYLPVLVAGLLGLLVVGVLGAGWLIVQEARRGDRLSTAVGELVEGYDTIAKPLLGRATVTSRRYGTTLNGTDYLHRRLKEQQSPVTRDVVREMRKGSGIGDQGSGRTTSPG